MTKRKNKRKTFELHLSKFELVHLRDLFGVLLATDAKTTVSQALASVEDRQIVEAKLWQRIAAACQSAKVDLNDSAPDFICAALVSPPPVGVFRISQEPNEGENQDSDEIDVFSDADDEIEDEADEDELSSRTGHLCCPSKRDGRVPSSDH